MSVHIMSAVWKHSKYRGNKLLVLLALADWANEEGICWPSMPAIAAKARISERGAREIVHGFIDDALIEVLDPGGGRNHSAKYRIRVERLNGKAASGFKAAKKGEAASGFVATNTESESSKTGKLAAENGEAGDRAIRKEPSIETVTKNRRATTTASVDLATVTKALREIVASIDQRAINKLIVGCCLNARSSGCDATTAEILHFVRAIAGRARNVENLVGFLITQVPLCFEGEAYRQARAEMAREAEKAQLREARHRQLRQELETWIDERAGIYPDGIPFDAVPAHLRDTAIEREQENC